MASWFRFVVLSRPVLLQELQVNTVWGVLGWEGGEKEREEDQDGVGEERDRSKGGGNYSSSLKHLSLQLSPWVRQDHKGCPCYQSRTSIYDD